ncbi:MAG: siderophore-interacting protein [Paracoccaceae bacterium]
MTHHAAHHALARLDLPYPLVRDWLVAAPVFEGRGRVEPDGSLALVFGTGTLAVAAAGDGTTLTLGSPDEASLQALRDFIAEEADEAGVIPLWQDSARRGRPANLCLARVERVESLSPAFRRIWLAGPDLARLMRGGLHFRLLLGPEGAAWPDLDDRGLTRWPGGQQAWHRPVYTIRDIRGEGRDTRIALDVFLHDGGRVSLWSERLTPGDEVALMGPSGGDIPAGPGGLAPWFGLFGDETALPAIARILAALPTDARGCAVVLVPSPADAQVLAHPPGIRLDWLFRGADGDQALLTALRARTLPQTGCFVFFAAGGQETAAARRHLDAAGLGKADYWAQAYWH